MVDFKEYIKPNRFKVVLFLVFIIPVLFSLLALVGLSLNRLTADIILLWLPLIGLPLAYLISCTLDVFVKNNTFKIIIASILGLISLIIGYIIIKTTTEPVVCDPVHRPSECELSCREIIENVTNRTAEINNKYNECMEQCMESSR